MPFKLQRILFGLGVAVVAIDLVWAAIGDFHIDVMAYSRLGLIALALLAMGIFYQNRRAEPGLAAMLMGTSFLCLFSAGASVLNYFLLTLHGPRIDHILVAADRALGFDWYRTMVFMTDYPLLNEVFFCIYNIVLPEIALVLVALAWSGQIDKVYRYCLAVGAGALIAIAVWGMAPSLGTQSLFHLPPEVAGKLTLSVSGDYGKALVALLQNGPGYISPAEIRGLIGFPSYHGVLALIVAWYGWHLRWLRWPLVLLNAAVIVCTPIQGGHHMVDLLGSFPVAALAIFLATRCARGEEIALMVNNSSRAAEFPFPVQAWSGNAPSLKKLPDSALSSN
ncbi:MAG TPA: phosphatase PAP2 family protein [Rhizomicrobium sp.]|nr:phosphatase PAP2 family protein [Rhizomicrobium sp.]